jgi:hypothetical protein
MRLVSRRNEIAAGIESSFSNSGTNVKTNLHPAMRGLGARNELMKNEIDKSKLNILDEPDCPECEELDDACPKCALEIHESWHEQGMFWIRAELCHPNCPGLKETP